MSRLWKMKMGQEDPRESPNEGGSTSKVKRREPQVDQLNEDSTFSGSNKCFFLLYTCPPRSSDYGRNAEGREGKI